MEVNNEKVSVLMGKQYCKMTTPPSSPSSKLGVERIEFYFAYKKTIMERYQDQDLPEFVRERQQPEIRNAVQVNAPQLFDYEKVYTSIERELNDWDISNDRRKQLVEHVLCQTEDILKSVSPGRDVVRVFSSVVIIETLTFPLSDAIDLMMQLSIEETEPRLVPAADSSIESLEKKLLTASDINDGTNRESCRICLEEFSVGCQAVCMPCSHLFHDDCIGDWLRTSHYCPICRFEMPKEELDHRC